MKNRKNKRATSHLTGERIPRRLLSVLLALWFVSSSVPFTALSVQAAEDTADRFLGDVNEDGSVSSEDARFTLRASVSLETCEKGGRTFETADYDRDGEISASDARMILRTSVKLETLFRILPDGSIDPVEEPDPVPSDPLTVEVFDGEDYCELELQLVSEYDHLFMADGELMFFTLEEFVKRHDFPRVTYCDKYDVRYSVSAAYDLSYGITIYREAEDELEPLEKTDVSSLKKGTYLVEYSFSLEKGQDYSAWYKAFFWLQIDSDEERPVWLPGNRIPSDPLTVGVFDGKAYREMNKELVYLNTDSLNADGALMFVPFEEFVRSHDLPHVTYCEKYDVRYSNSVAYELSHGITIYRDTGEALEAMKNKDVSTLEKGTYLMEYSFSVNKGRSYSAYYKVLFWLEIGPDGETE